MSLIRTFIAVEVSEGVRTRVAELIAELRSSGAKVSWIRPENMHLTLKFLGDTDETRIPAICQAVAAAAGQSGPLALRFRSAGAFPKIHRPQTLWVGVVEGEAEICRLAAAIDQLLAAQGFPREQRPFTPHLTIGRVRGGGPACSDLADRLRLNVDFDAGTAAIGAVLVLASHLAPSGATYEVLGRASLGPVK